MLPVAHFASDLALFELMPVTLVGALYALRVASLAAQGQPVPLRKQLLFATGIVVILVAIVSPASSIAGELILAHMIQHLLLADLAALFIVLGLTGPILQPVLSIRRLAWLRAMFHPLVAFPFWVGNLYVWHVPVLYEGVLTSEPLHMLMHSGFLASGIVMWMSLVGPLPKPAWFGYGAQLIYVGAVRLAGAALGNVLQWSGTVLYPAYRPGQAEWGIAPLADQGTAGVVMMIESGTITLAVMAWLLLRWARESEEAQRILDLAAERGIELDQARAARAVAAGEGERLLRRVEEADPELGMYAGRGRPA